jgi:LCP family protein required for cell wall assembly
VTGGTQWGESTWHAPRDRDVAQGRDVPGSRHSHRAQARPRGGASTRARAVRIGKLVAALMSVTLLLGFGYGWYEYRSLDNGLQRLHLTNLAGAGAPAKPGSKFKGTEQNILVVGLDSRDGLSAAERQLLSVGNDNSLSTDTIMIIHVPADGSKATMISIPRDSYVDIPGGYLKNKINAAYADAYVDSSGSDKQKQAAGANELVSTVSKLTGLKINHYIQVGFGGFYTITKAVGAVPVNLCHATDDTIAYNEASGQGRVGSNFKMSAGKHDLTAVQAMQFVRQRHNLTGGDIAREKRQRYFLAAAFNKIVSAGVLLNPVKLSHLIQAVTGSFYVDDNGFSLADLAEQMTNLSAGNIVGYTIPTQGTSTVDIGGLSQSVELVDPALVKSRIARILAGSSSTTPARTTPHSSASTAPTSTTAGTTTPATTPAPKADAGCIN